jgi:hypothetical protein
MVDENAINHPNHFPRPFSLLRWTRSKPGCGVAVIFIWSPKPRNGIAVHCPTSCLLEVNERELCEGSSAVAPATSERVLMNHFAHQWLNCNAEYIMRCCCRCVVSIVLWMGGVQLCYLASLGTRVDLTRSSTDCTENIWRHRRFHYPFFIAFLDRSHCPWPICHVSRDTDLNNDGDMADRRFQNLQPPSSTTLTFRHHVVC